MLKRIIDITFSFIALSILIPLFLVLAFLIKLEDKGPIFYVSVRIGKDGVPFRILKIRTMVLNADKIGGVLSPANDIRITRIGRFVRRYNLDELPQFINVLSGNMSIVGPRPDVLQNIALLSEEEKKSILSVLPGITDYATIWIRDMGERLIKYDNICRGYFEEIRPQKIALQLVYVKNHSIPIDLKIMLLTLKVHFFGRFKRNVKDKLPKI